MCIMVFFQVGQYFYINKILKFRPNKLSDVELIKIDTDINEMENAQATI